MSTKNPFDVIFEEVCSSLNDHGKVNTISKEFMQLDSNYDRVKFLLELPSIADVVQLPEVLIQNTELAKSVKRSADLRADGNSLFQKKRYSEALAQYTASLSFAPILDDRKTRNGSDAISRRVEDNHLNEAATCAALSFANRSAVLFYVKEYELCVRDIDDAFALAYPPGLRYKLHCRRARCLLSLRRRVDAVQGFAAALASLDVAELTERQRELSKKEIEKYSENCDAIEIKANSDVEFNVESLSFLEKDVCRSNFTLSADTVIPSLGSNINSLFPSLTAGVSVVYTDGVGRHIVATCDILPGEVILVEQPYAAIMLAERYTAHCSHCFAHSLAPRPCHQCHSALYCSENCRLAAFQAHQAECAGVLEILRLSGLDKFAFLSVRAVLNMSAASLMSYRQQVNAGEYQVKEKLFQGCGRDGVYLAEDYNAICCLVTHEDQRAAHDLFKRAVIAVYLLRVLQLCGYFQNLSTSSQEKSAEAVSDAADVHSYVGGLLLSHLQAFPCNAHEISEFSLNVAAGVADSLPHELGAGIYSTLSLFNHSCDPAVTRSFYGRVCVVRAIRALQAGDEVSDNYGAVYAMQPRVERRVKLAPQYFFECACEACVDDWPLYAGLLAAPPVWRCVCTAAVHCVVGGCRCQHEAAGNEASCVGNEASGAGDSCAHKAASAHASSSPSASDSPARTYSLRHFASDCVCRPGADGRLDKLKVSYCAYKVAFESLLGGNVRQALPVLLAHMRVVGELCCRPSVELCSCQEAVKQCFSIMSNCCVLTRPIND